MEEVIVLTGFMGVGKTSVARQLAKRLGWDAVDLDDIIEAEAGKTIHAIFESEGEEGFRQRETRALRAVLGRKRLVIAGGGGVLLREDNRAALAGRMVINLSAPFEEIATRLGNDPDVRPLARDGEQALRRLYERRQPLYSAVPRQVDTGGKTPEAVAGEIRKRYLSDAEEAPTCG